MYKDGLGVEQNVPAAVKHLTAAAQAYHVRALSMLGSAIYDEQSWLATYRRAALNTLSVLFDVDELIDMEIDGGVDGEGLDGANGDGQSNSVPLLHRSCQTALPLLKAAADVGPWVVEPVRDGLEQYLGGDLKESLKSYQRAADAGVAVAQDNAAFLHDALAKRECWWLRGQAKQDCMRTHKSAALRRNIQLANAGDVRALRVLGDELSKGRWLSRDTSAGFRAYAVAAELGDDEALFNVARAFHTGTGTEKNVTIARRLYKALMDFELEDFSLMQVYSAQGLDVAPAGTYGVAPALMLGLLRLEEWWESWQSWYHANQTAAPSSTPSPPPSRGGGGGGGGGVRLDMESVLLSCCVATFVMLGVYRLARRRRQALFAQRMSARRA
jgi:TPR repeat protein